MTAAIEANAHVIQVTKDGDTESHLSLYGQETDYGIASLCGQWFKAADVVNENAEAEGNICIECFGAPASS